MERERPVLIYDGDCGFCKLWIARWEAITGDRVEYRSSEDAAPEFPEISFEAFSGSVQFVDVDGRRYDRALAVFRSLATATFLGRVLTAGYERVPFFARICDGAYGFVANNRMFFSRLTRLLWGRNATPPTYAMATTVFLRVLGLIYLIAFLSFLAQAKGLFGPHGILPVNEVFPLIAHADGANAIWKYPTLVWLRPDEDTLAILTWAGTGCAILILLGIVQPLAFLGAWAAYLSLSMAGLDFYALQWDILLLETGMLAVFVPPWRWRPNFERCAPPWLARFLLVWLLFRLMFSSGIVKLSSGDKTWTDLAALDFHYWTQPIPNAVAWFVAQAPGWFQRMSCGGMFVIELGFPFLMFLPRRPRLLAFAGLATLQLLIALTGNYGFFNLLALALTMLLLDDSVWPGSPRGTRVVWSRWVLPLPALGYLLLSLVPLAGAFRSMPPVLEPLAWVYAHVAPFRSINGYGLFAVMTTERPEIVLQGSMDGVTWKTYEFKDKPGPLNRRPPFVAPYMPRLDWQMWFAAMQDAGSAPWMESFVARLFEARPEVLALLGRDPFDGQAPRFIRANLADYHFTNFTQLRESGNWWVSDPKGIYFSEVPRDAFVR